MSPTPSNRLPEEVTTCLKNARFLHLATCTGNVPHVSLMHFSYLPPSSFPQGSSLPSGPTIIMTSDPHSKKTTNLTSNPNVSLLVHDWVSSRPPTNATSNDRERSPIGGPRSSLAQMLMQMNSNAVSSISATINGAARVLEKGSEEEKWCKEQHLAMNSFEGEGEERGQGLSRSSSGAAAGDGGRGSYIEDEDVRVVVVEIRDGRISDWKGGVTEWVIEGAGQQQREGGGETEKENGGRPLVNGVVRC